MIAFDAEGPNANNVRTAIEDIALNPSSVGLTHAKILRDEISRLRGIIAEFVRAEMGSQPGTTESANGT